MSKINELIQTLCPDGVEYKKLGEVATNMFRGNGIKRDEVTENGTPCVRYGEIYTTYDIWFDTCVSHTDVDRLKSPKYFGYGAVLIAITGESVLDIAKSTVYVGYERCLAGGDILVVEHEQNPKYMGYVLSTTDAQDQKSAGKIKSKVVHAIAKDLAEITIPIPPPSVQEEIVRILDEYTNLEAELEAKLSEEIELKQKQYEVYRDELLTFGDNVEYKSLKDLYEYRRGSFPQPYTNMSFYGGDNAAPFVQVADVCDDGFCLADKTKQTISKIAQPKSVFVKKGTVIVTLQGTIGRVAITQYDAYVDRTLAIFTKCKVSDLNKQYFSYCLKSIFDEKKKLARGSTIKTITKEEFSEFVIPVPSPTEQERIVKTLDKYDTYTRDMISTLNTELESRKKQYAYYRDQLLTFKRKE